MIAIIWATWFAAGIKANASDVNSCAQQDYNQIPSRKNAMGGVSWTGMWESKCMNGVTYTSNCMYLTLNRANRRVWLDIAEICIKHSYPGQITQGRRMNETRNDGGGKDWRDGDELVNPSAITGLGTGNTSHCPSDCLGSHL
jgi:hypothetical protein